jgi:hypothetical protein
VPLILTYYFSNVCDYLQEKENEKMDVSIPTHYTYEELTEITYLGSAIVCIILMNSKHRES